MSKIHKCPHKIIGYAAILVYCEMPSLSLIRYDFRTLTKAHCIRHGRCYIWKTSLRLLTGGKSLL